MEKIVTLLLMPAMEILVPMMLNVTWWKLEDFRKYSAKRGVLPVSFPVDLLLWQ